MLKKRRLEKWKNADLIVKNARAGPGSRPVYTCFSDKFLWENIDTIPSPGLDPLLLMKKSYR